MSNTNEKLEDAIVNTVEAVLTTLSGDEVSGVRAEKSEVSDNRASPSQSRKLWEEIPASEYDARTDFALVMADLVNGKPIEGYVRPVPQSKAEDWLPLKAIVRHWQQFAKKLSDILGCMSIDTDILEAVKRLKAQSKTEEATDTKRLDKVAEIALKLISDLRCPKSFGCWVIIERAKKAIDAVMAKDKQP
jgi:hypothetical protein